MISSPSWHGVHAASAQQLPLHFVTFFFSKSWTSRLYYCLGSPSQPTEDDDYITTFSSVKQAGFLPLHNDMIIQESPSRFVQNSLRLREVN